MAKLYLMRHGQTLFNAMHRTQGWCDSPLTDEGIAQARRAGEWIRAQGLTFDHCYTSTAERACDTFELAMPGVPYERLKSIKERNFGVFEGLTEDVSAPVPFGDFYVPFGGESDGEFQARVISSLTEIMGRPDHECVLAVGHGGFCVALLHLLGETARRPGNCGIIELEYNHDTGFRVVQVYDPNEDPR